MSEVSQALVDRAIEAAEAIKSSDDRSRSLYNIALAQREAGNVEASRALVDRAIEAAESSNTYSRGRILHTIALGYRRGGDIDTARAVLERAIEAANAMGWSYDRAMGLAETAKSQAAMGDGGGCTGNDPGGRDRNVVV